MPNSNIMQIRVISLNRASPLIRKLQSLFPDADVGVQTGIDVRGSSISSLVFSDLITHSVAHTLEHGRRWHHEVPTNGAVGLAQANRLAVEDDVTQPLLLLEEDCVISDEKKLKREIKQLLRHSDKFDLATFGSLYRGDKTGIRDARWLPDGFKVVSDMFWLMHCVLYTPSGRRRVAQLLRRPLDMQIDSLYGVEAKLGHLTVVCQLTTWTTYQSRHISTVQSGMGGLNADNHYHTLQYTLSVVIVLLVMYHLAYIRIANHTRRAH